jgi:nucleotide-binding universal stress UspA family protein
VLLRVLAPPIISTLWSAHAAAFSRAAHDEEAMICTAYLADQAQRLEAADLAVETELLVGDPARCIVERARASRFRCMIAMTTHGHGDALHWVLGSVAAKVVHAAPVPLLLVRVDATDIPRTTAPQLKTILVALDGSAFAECALQEARELAQVAAARLNLVTVLEGSPPSTAEIDNREAAPTLSDETRSYLQQIAHSIEWEGVTVHSELTYGKPAETILRVSAELKADLLVLATHGRTGFHGLWLGGVAMKVTQRSRCPVLLIRPDMRSLSDT